MTVRPTLIDILSPGNLLTVQDLGRRGSQRFGVSVSGVLDHQAAVLANRLVGNPPTSAMLEAAFGGVSLAINREIKAAVTGATVDVYIDDVQMPLWETLIVPAGATLSISVPNQGLYSYIAIAGGIETPEVLGSRSTHLGSSLGGYEGRALSQGDKLQVDDDSASAERPKAGTMAPADLNRACDDAQRAIRVLPGPQHENFENDAHSVFVNSTFTISNVTNRQGARLEGPAVPAIEGRHDIVSDPAYMGAVQVPSDGQPIVLLADRQPTGGYAKIASVISADLPAVVQRPPGTPIAFELTDLESAQREARSFMQKLYENPLIAPPSLFYSNLEVDGKTYNVDLVQPSNVEEINETNGIVYATLDGGVDNAVVVETTG